MWCETCIQWDDDGVLWSTWPGLCGWRDDVREAWSSRSLVNCWRLLVTIWSLLAELDLSHQMELHALWLSSLKANVKELLSLNAPWWSLIIEHTAPDYHEHPAEDQCRREHPGCLAVSPHSSLLILPDERWSSPRRCRFSPRIVLLQRFWEDHRCVFVAPFVERPVASPRTDSMTGNLTSLCE